jgi:hypothetical protein
MVIFHGRKNARIKRFTDNEQYCPSCKAFDLEIKIYRDYYHLYFIPIVALGAKTAKIRCKSCGEPLRSEIREKGYVDASRTPFYLYSIPILIGTIILFIFLNNYYTQKQTSKYVEYPQLKDVYLIKSNANKLESYYFTKIVVIKPDSILMLHSKFEYLFLQNNFSDEDYFTKDDTLIFLRKELKKMLDSSEISVVNRNYNESTGFNRMQ